ncbi:Crp/Fnr family transcriptional regulator [Fodinicurvata sp. EGI_FJ10296]|uniref:Crp/Fnr family transcriptional regulator n=1 Tax=Fodinicurvata sp. EGI_FJ10296 TaxID=3231908 RepID=UPI0034555DDA
MDSPPRGPRSAAATVEHLRSQSRSRIGPSLASLLVKLARRTRPGLLSFEGDGVLFPLAGWISLFKMMENGNTQIIDFALPGDIVHLATGDGITIEVLEEGFVAVIPSAQWEQLMQDEPDVLRLVLRESAAARSRIAERMLRLGKGSAEMRLAYVLLELCLRVTGGNRATSAPFHVPLTQQRIGDFIGLTSVHISRTTRRLTRLGAIRMTDHLTFELTDVDALCEIAGFDMDTLRHKILLPMGT